MNKKYNYPVRGVIYTLATMLNDLDLSDSPHLKIQIKGRECCIQDSHITYENFLSVEGAAESKWLYIRTTHEEIPCFEFVGSEDDLLKFVMYETQVGTIEHDGIDNESFWCVPKGFPREQYYAKNYPELNLYLDPERS